MVFLSPVNKNSFPQKKARILCIFDAKLIKDEKSFLADVIVCDLCFDNLLLFRLQEKTTPQPDFPQLVGHWSGTTSQGTAVSFTVDNLQGNLNVTRYDLMVYTQGGYRQYKVINSNGIAYVTNKQFKIHIGTGDSGESFIDGTFNVNDLSLYGNFAVYEPGNTIDIITGTYTCSIGN